MRTSVEIIAHRGASYDAPENTLSAFELAWQQNADAVEVDVRLSRDGHIVVCHDADTARVTGTPGKIDELTLSQIQALDAGSWKGHSWKGEKIPLLEELLTRLPEGKRLFIEIKCGSEILPLLEELFHRSGRSDQVVLIGFGVQTMKDAKQRFPHIPVFLLFGFGKLFLQIIRLWAPHIEKFIAQAKDAHADGLNLPHQTLSDMTWIETVKNAGLNAYVWTVDDEVTAKHLVKSGIEGITTNRPGWLRQHLNS